MPATARPASIKDVAATAGVAVGTVSNVLNRPGKVGDTTRQRVESAIRELGFVRNESARQLRAGTSRTLAYVVPENGNPFFSDVTRALDLHADAHGLTVMTCCSNGRHEREQALLDLLEQQRVQGLLITPVDPSSPALAAVASRGTPVVIVDRTLPTPTLCSVAVDDVLGGRLAVAHLLAQGHERIAFVGAGQPAGQVRDRLAGARAAWIQAGMAEEDLKVLLTNSLGVDDGRTAGMRLAGLPKRQRPTAAFCANDLVALGLLQHAITSGISVPDQLAIVGYDDIEFAGAAAVPITSIRQPRELLGRTAAELAISEATEHGHEHRQVLFTPELVVRTSTLR